MKVNVNHMLHSGLEPEYTSVSEIELGSNIGFGAFGDVYECLSVNGQTVTKATVMKIFKDFDDNSHKQAFSTVQKLQAKLRDEHQRLVNQGSPSLLDEYTLLRAAPLFSFEGELQNEPVLGFAAYNLTAQGFMSLEEVFESYYEELTSIELTDGITMANDLVKGFQFLSGIYFIHADLKEDAVYINFNTGECAIIDYDGGVLMENPREEPMTFGTLQEWLAPEVFEQMGSDDQGHVKVNLFTDLWSVAVCLYFLFLGQHPYFFLTDTGSNSVNTYLNQYSWPDINSQFEHYNPDAEPNLAYHQHKLQQIPAELLKLFKVTFQNGYQTPSMRVDYPHWLNTFATYLKPPHIHDFSATPRQLTKKEKVVLTWKVDGAAKIAIDGKDVTTITTLEVWPRSNTTYTLSATNKHGSNQKVVLVTTSNKAPVIQFLKEVASKKPWITQLSWDVTGADELELLPTPGDVTGKESVEVSSTDTQKFTLVARSYFGQESKRSLTIDSLFHPDPDDSIFFQGLDDSLFHPDPDDSLFYT